MRLLLLLSLFGILLLLVSAKKQLEENVDPLGETEEHASKKYSKTSQKSHHHGHKHKKNNGQEEQAKEIPKPKSAPVDIPEPEVQLQENVKTSKKAVEERKRKENTEDLHLQDLAYEESLKKEKKKKGHHGAHHAEVVGKDEQKLFSEHQAKKVAGEKVIEDSFEPLKNTEGGKKNKNKDKKSKDKQKNKKASEKNKDKTKKSKDGKNKNKDKKHKNKDKKKW